MTLIFQGLHTPFLFYLVHRIILSLSRFCGIIIYQTLEMQTRTKNYEGWTAQIIQHEVDHYNGC